MARRHAGAAGAAAAAAAPAIVANHVQWLQRHRNSVETMSARGAT